MLGNMSESTPYDQQLVRYCNPNGKGHILLPRVDYEGVNTKST